MDKEFFDKSYYESGPQSEKSLYQNFRWIPELTIPLAHHIVQSMGIMHDQTVMDFGCAKGYLVNALRLLKLEAYGVDLVLLGHDHVYGRSANINGVHYVISGGGGSTLYNSKEDEHMIKCRKVYHYVRFQVKNGALSWTAIGDDGAIIDTYELTKK